jgi:hypothetical protein
LRTAGAVTAELRSEPGPLEAALAALQGVRKAEIIPLDDGWVGCTLRIDAQHDPREQIARVAAERGWPLRQLGQEQVSLERVFAEITQAGEI